MRFRALCVLFVCVGVVASNAAAQTATYHLHKEASTTPGLFQLRTAGPDASSLAIQSINLKNQPAGEYIVKAFDTASGTPGVTGTIPSGSTITFIVWMKKTANKGTMFPRVRARLNSQAGALLCDATGTSALTQTLTAFTLTCTTSAAIAMTSTDRFYVWVGISLTGTSNSNVQAVLNVEGTLNGNYDSRVTLPLPVLPNISGVSPTSGPVGQTVTITGTNFGSSQGSSTVTFNGAAAPVTSWSATSVTAVVPSGATTGPVVVTVNGQASNGVTFTIVSPPTISALNPTSGSVGASVTITGTNFGITQGGSTVSFNGTQATPTSWSDTSVGVTVPAGAASGPVVVTVNGQPSNGVTFTVTTSSTGSIQYRYDALGRLITVIDRDGSAATYNYDAVGNLLSITRSTSSVVTISGFTPNDGFAGATVTIDGSGFSTTPTENVVTFGGRLATVTTSTPTQIVTTVPLGATTGPISVVTPSGAAVSGSTFTVLGGGQPPNQPTLSSFSPTTGAAGTSVQINGTNFDPDVGDNTVLFNTTAAALTNASANTLNATVPSGATSGKITVITPSGQATSADDFVIPPPPHPIADVDDATRLQYGVLQPVDVPQGKIAIFFFDGAANDWINFELVYPPFTSPYLDATLTLLGPTGTSLYTNYAFPTHAAIQLPSAGTYSLIVDATNGPALFDLGVARDVVETVNIISQNTTVRVTVRDLFQNARVRLIDGTGGAFGDRLAVKVSDVAPFRSLIALMTDDGTVLRSDYLVRDERENLQLYTTLPPYGTLILLVDPDLQELGSVTLSLTHPAPDAVIVAGTPVSVANSAPGQNMQLVFNGNAGQRVSIDVDPVGGIDIFTNIRFIAPNGTVLATGQLNSGQDFIDALDLPSSGSYTIEIDPPGANVGGVVVTLYDITDLTVAATIGGPAVNFTFTTPGQNATATFGGTAGMRVAFAFTGLTSALISLRGPDGSFVISPIGRPPFTDAVLTQTGTHTLVIDPSRTTLGALGVTLTEPPPDVTNTIVPGGPSVAITIPSAGQNAQITFDAVAGQRVSLQLTAVTIQWSIVSIHKPDGSTLSSTNVFTSGGFLDTNVLADTGTYTIVVDPKEAYTGDITLTLHNVSVDASASASIDGPPVTVTVGTPGQVGAVAFAGSAGQHVSVNITSVSISSSNVSVLNPDGSTLIAPTSMFTSGKFLDGTLLATGTHTVRIDPVGTATGSATVTLATVPADVTSSITIGGPPVSVSIPAAGQNARLTFAAAAGQRVSVQLTSVTISSSVVSIRRPDDTVLSSTTVGTSGGFLDTNLLSTAGTYTILVDPNGTATGSMTVQLYDVPADLSGPIAPGGSPVTVAIGSIGQNATLSFTGSVGQRISLRASGVSASSFVVSILRPNGSTVASATVGTSGGFIDLNTLSDAGTFTIKVDPVTTTTGSLTLTLYQVPVDTVATATIGGGGVPVTIAIPGQNGMVRFDGVGGQQATVHITGNTFGSVTVRLLHPDSTTMTTKVSSLSSFDLTTQTLPITGPYRITVNPGSSATGTLTVSVTSP